MMSLLEVIAALLEALALFILLHKHFVCSSPSWNPLRYPEPAGISERSLWMTWINNCSVAAAQGSVWCDFHERLFNLLLDVIALRASAGGRIHPPLDWAAEAASTCTPRCDTYRGVSAGQRHEARTEMRSSPTNTLTLNWLASMFSHIPTPVTPSLH